MGPLGRNQADEKSPVTGDCHAGICGSRGVKFPPATRPEHPLHRSGSVPSCQSRAIEPEGHPVGTSASE